MIPDGWVENTLGDVTTWRSGGTPPMINKSFWTGDIPWISASTMYSNAFDTSTKFISDEGLKAGSKLAKPNDLLLLVRGSMLWNRIPIGIAKIDLAFNQDVKSITASSNLLPNFLLFWFLANENKFLHMVTGTGIGAGKLDTKELQGMEIEVPPLPEQKKIAEILSTWDKAIATVEKLISNSQQKKKALMQQLLTGKKRFPEFDGEWKEVQLKDCANSLDNKRIPLNSEQRSVMKGSVPYWGANGIVDYVNDYIIDEAVVLLAEDGGYFNEFSSREIANISYGKAWVNNHAHILKAKENSTNEWLYYSLVHKNILGFINGGTRAKLNKSDMLLIPILLPSIKEQKRIASVLSSADQEIETWQQELENLKQEKKALMQQLLTGKRRVKVAVSATETLQLGGSHEV